MSDYLTSVVMRTLHPSEALRPRRPAAFEPARYEIASYEGAEEREEVSSERSENAVHRIQSALERTAPIVEEPQPATATLPKSPMPGAPDRTVTLPAAEQRRVEMHGQRSAKPAPLPRPSAEDLQSPEREAAPRRENTVQEPIGQATASGGLLEGDAPVRMATRTERSLQATRLPHEEDWTENVVQQRRENDVPPLATQRRTANAHAVVSQAIAAPGKAPESKSDSPSIRITIGRVQVRATFQTTPAEPKTPPQKHATNHLSLEDYLGARKREAR